MKHEHIHHPNHGSTAKHRPAGSDEGFIVSEESNPILSYADSYRQMARTGTISIDVWSVITDLERNMAPLMTAAQSELAALREELAELGERYSKLQTGEDSMLHRVIAERDAAEQRNAAIVGKVTKCKECGSDDLFWFAQNTVPNGIQRNRLSTHDVKCVFVLGCNNCSETLKLVSSDKIAEQMTAALKPTESGARE